MWIKITEVFGITEAQIVKGLLSSHGIPVKLRYESAAALFGIRLNGIGKVEVLVPTEYKKLAQQLLIDCQKPDSHQTSKLQDFS